MLGHVCVPVGMAAAEVEKLDELVKERVRVEKGKTLFSLDHPLDAVYGVRFGSLKTQLEDATGQIQITGFHTGNANGDILFGAPDAGSLHQHIFGAAKSARIKRRHLLFAFGPQKAGALPRHSLAHLRHARRRVPGRGE